MAGPQISTARQLETKRLKTEWELKNAARIDELRQLYGPQFRGFDDVGRPIIEGQETRSLRGPEFVEALERAFLATGDPIFDDALRAAHAYGLNHGGHKSIALDSWGSMDDSLLMQIRYFVDRKRMSSRAASEKIVSEFCVKGPSFERAVDRIRQKFDKWKRSHYEAEEIDYEAGNLGYRIAVSPTAGMSLERLTRPLPTQGEDQPATSYWRRLFREGAITIRFLGER